MIDVMSKAERSRLMARIRGRDTLPELNVRRGLWRSGFRGYRLRPHLPGKPDIVFPRAKVAIFVDGCFWHGCPRCYTRPATRKRFWDQKLRANMARDRRVDASLGDMGWTIRHFWEHEIEEDPGRVVQEIGMLLRDHAFSGLA